MADLSQKDKDSLVSKIGEKIQKAVTPKWVSQDQVSQMAQGPSQPSGVKGFLGKIFNFAKPAISMGIGAIPGVGAVASKIFDAVTSNNDDEWFEEFGGAGAAFNELLAVSDVHKAGDGYYEHFINVQASVGRIELSFNKDYLFQDEIMPSVLAYVRKKTNNVLMDDVATYTNCMKATIDLYCLYYTLRKYCELATNIPLNIPQIAELFPALQPQYFNQAVGVADTLKHYLETTCGIPYALAAYLRWRFGTVFHSDSTGKPGLIFYDFRYDNEVTGTTLDWTSEGDPVDFITSLGDVIAELKATIASCGRASADFNVAYAGNGVKLDIEVPHYDSKEYNLRMNLRLGGDANESRVAGGKHTVVMDSRFVQNPALQAVTISTPTLDGTAPLQVKNIFAYCYSPNASFCGYTNISNDLAKLVWGNCSVQYSKYWAKLDAKVMWDSSYMKVDFTYPSVVNTKPNGLDYATDGDISLSKTMLHATDMFYHFAATSAFTALQLHNIWFLTGARFAEYGVSDNYYLFLSQPIAYDTAFINDASLTSIHRTALRNLFRGEYSRKAESKSLKSEMKEAAEEVSAEILPEKIKVSTN